MADAGGVTSGTEAQKMTAKWWGAAAEEFDLNALDWEALMVIRKSTFVRTNVVSSIKCKCL